MVYSIYKLTCSICDHFYIGQTCGTILERYNQHRQMAHRRYKTTLYVHMRNHGIMNFKINKLWKIETQNTELVNDIEMFFIKQLKPKLNIHTRKIKEKGMKEYLREYREKMREAQNHRCSVCNLNCAARLHLIRHFETKKHMRNENRMNYAFDEL